MNLVDRTKRILVEPRDEWVKIAAEPATVQSLYTSWIMILAAIGPIALLLSAASLQSAVALYIRWLIATFVLALVVDGFAPSFGGTKNFVASLKLTAYSSTVVWLAGAFYLFGTLVGSLASWIAMVYALYPCFLGAPVLNKASQDKAVPFTLLVALCAVVLFFIARFALTGVATPPLHAGMGMAIR